MASPSKASAMRYNSNFSFQLFYDQLSPYGTWIDSPEYGYVWLPDVDAGFSPYATDGHWEFTDYGWTWVSDYVWGWAPFHYGRWLNDPYYGAMWVPDYEWGPAWVTWRRADGYFGWTPMAPGININISFGRDYYVPSERWIFVRDRDFCRHDINRYYVNQTNNYTIINNSTVIINTNTDNSRHVKYVTGPDRNEVQRRTNSVIRPLAVRENDRPGQSYNNNELRIYRPNVTNDRNNGTRYAPAKVSSIQDVKPRSERKASDNARYEGQSRNNRTIEATGKNTRQLDNQRNQQPARNVNSENNQRNQQPARKVNSENSQRNQQPARNVNTENNQRNQQPARNVNTENNQRNQQPARNVKTENSQRNQQPARNVNTENSQRNQQPARNVNTENSQRNQQPARNVNTESNQSNQQPARTANTENSQRNQQPARNVNTENSQRTQKPAKSATSTEKRSGDRQPSQSGSVDKNEKKNGRNARNNPK